LARFWDLDRFLCLVQVGKIYYQQRHQKEVQTSTSGYKLGKSMWEAFETIKEINLNNTEADIEMGLIQDSDTTQMLVRATENGLQIAQGGTNGFDARNETFENLENPEFQDTTRFVIICECHSYGVALRNDS